jgi:hypothetical protein
MPVPTTTTLGDLIDRCLESHTETPGRTKAATLAMPKRELGQVTLAALSSVTMRDLIDRRAKAGAGGVTIAADLSSLSSVLERGVPRPAARHPRAAGPGRPRNAAAPRPEHPRV